MKSTLRIAGIVLAVNALTATAAVAAVHPGQHDTAGHHATKGTAKGAGHAHVTAHTTGVKVLRKLAHLDRRLVLVEKVSRVGRLDDADQASVLTNVEADRGTVAGVTAALESDVNDANLAAAHTVLTTLHPTVYVRAVNLLRHSERLTARIDALTALVDPTGQDATDLADATALLATLPASGFTAATDGATLRAAQHSVAEAQALVGGVAADVAA